MRPGRVRIQGQVPAEGPRGQNRTERGGDPGSMVLALSPGSTAGSPPGIWFEGAELRRK